MPAGKPEFEIEEEFSQLAHQIVDKYPEAFHTIDVDKIRCAKIINKTRPEKTDSLWKLMAVKMPIRLDCPFAWYVTIFASDWDAMAETQKLLLISQVLFAIPGGEDSEGKVNTFDSKDFSVMQRTFKTIDYLEDPSMPNIIERDIEWVTSYQPLQNSKEEIKIND